MAELQLAHLAVLQGGEDGPRAARLMLVEIVVQFVTRDEVVLGQLGVEGDRGVGREDAAVALRVVA
ncbi:hypothetical protein ACFQ7N_38725 [Streptomyces niveus]|uniref:hypothetical protein n=1 Tax=Streptomyces niveus TaxID=193462 RepID=UPI0036B2B083